MNENKPLSIAIQEARNDIANAINKQTLHSSIMRMIIKEIYDEVCILDNQIIASEKEKYDSSQEQNDMIKDNYME